MKIRNKSENTDDSLFGDILDGRLISYDYDKRLDYCFKQWEFYEAACKKYVDRFTPVILAGGWNVRFGDVSKPLQTIAGKPALVRVIDQLKDSGFREDDIYVVTNFSVRYRSEPFWFFYSGMGKDMKVNNITFKEGWKLTRAQVLKRFADGNLEMIEKKYLDKKAIRKIKIERSYYKSAVPCPTYLHVKPNLKKNLLVLHADNIFLDERPILYFVTKAGEFMDEKGNGYCILDMYNLWDSVFSRRQKFVDLLTTREPLRSIVKTLLGKTLSGLVKYKMQPRTEVCACAFDRERYKQVKIPKKDVSLVDYMCKEMDRLDERGKRLRFDYFFWNMNTRKTYEYVLLLNRNLLDRTI